jgi:hypothetical protein
MVVIPSTVNNLPVATIGDSAFQNSVATSVMIPDGVTNIGDFAFSGCSGLTSVTIPNSVTNIGESAFSGCTSLTGISVDAQNADYSSLNGVLFDKQQTTLIQYPSGQSGSYTIPDSVTIIGDGAFSECYRLTRVTIPDSVTSIGDGAFSECYNLNSVTIPDGVTNIGDYAFSGCSGLTSVTIPNSVISIGIDPFFYCLDLVSIIVDADNPSYSSVAGVLFNKSQTVLIVYPDHCGESYTIPGSVTNIADDAFCTSTLFNVTIPNGVVSIGDQAFADCYWLTTAEIPNSVTSIGDSAFEGCALANVVIPDSVRNMGFDTFANCSELSEVTIGSGVTNIEGFDFSSCGSLTNMTVPANVTAIGDYAFEYCGNLGRVYFPGNAPTADCTVFQGDNVTVYYLPGTMGWGATFACVPTALWYQPNPMISGGGSGFGVTTNGFGFTISWATNLSVIVQATTNLANPVWTPLATNPLVNGTNYFSDPLWTNYPGRFYRITAP